MGNKELKPCPFCGNDNVHCETETGLFQVKHTFIRCDICGAIVSFKRKTEKDILKQWNKREAEAAE